MEKIVKKYLPNEYIKAWNDRHGPVVFATVDKKALPNAIYASCVKLYEEGRIVIADNHFDKTRANIRSGSKGAVLFISTENDSFQVKGTIEYHTEGRFYNEMKKWLDPKFPGHAAAVINIEEIYSGSRKLL